MKKLVVIFGIIFLGINYTFAQEQSSFEIIPSSSEDASSIVSDIASGGHVWDVYKEKSQGNMSLATQFASGVMTWDTILDYAVYLMKFLGQLALLVGAAMFIYLGYKKAFLPLLSKSNNNVTRLILGIIIISASYVIIRLIWSMFIS